MKAADDFAHAEESALYLLSRTTLRPHIAVVVGSGLGGFSRELQNAVRVPYGEIPNFPVSTAVGHAGVLAFGSYNNVPLAVMEGRHHLYEGYSARQVAFPVRSSHAWASRRWC